MEPAPKETKRVRKPLNYKLGEIDFTALDVDPATGEGIPGTAKMVIVLQDLPPGLDHTKSRSRDQIKKAVRKAVYEDGRKEFGNRKLVVVTFDEPFEVPFTEVTETKLIPPGS